MAGCSGGLVMIMMTVMMMTVMMMDVTLSHRGWHAIALQNFELKCVAFDAAALPLQRSRWHAEDF